MCGSGGAVGGDVVLHTHGTDNNECAVATTNKPFKFADDKPIIFEALVQYTEANTDDANIFIGLSSVLGTADMMLDNGAGPAASFSGCGFYKVDGETAWRFVTSMGSTQTKSALSSSTAGGSAAVQFTIRVNMLTATQAEVIPLIDGQPLLDATYLKPIKHYITLSSPAQMQAGVYAKAGGANSEDPHVDYIACYQKR
jgi:hypothetical protein